MMVNPMFMPPPRPGYIFYSNFSKTGETMEQATKETAERLEIPELDVHVEPFKGMLAAYVKQEHGDKVAKFLQHLSQLMAECEAIVRGEGLD